MLDVRPVGLLGVSRVVSCVVRRLSSVQVVSGVKRLSR